MTHHRRGPLCCPADKNRRSIDRIVYSSLFSTNQNCNFQQHTHTSDSESNFGLSRRSLASSGWTDSGAGAAGATKAKYRFGNTTVEISMDGRGLGSLDRIEWSEHAWEFMPVVHRTQTELQTSRLQPDLVSMGPPQKMAMNYLYGWVCSRVV